MVITDKEIDTIATPNFALTRTDMLTVEIFTVNKDYLFSLCQEGNFSYLRRFSNEQWEMFENDGCGYWKGIKTQYIQELENNRELLTSWNV